MPLPRMGLPARRGSANEPFEDALPIFAEHARPTVDDPDDDRTALALDADRDDAGARGVFERVVDQVDDGELDGPLVDT